MGIAERTDFLVSWRFLSALVPVLCGFVAVLASNLPLSLTNGLVPTPLLGLVPIYFWCLVRPDLMTPAAVFAIGILEDVVAGGPPGVWTLSFVITYAVIDRQRDAFAGLPGLGAVLGFATAALITCACAYFIIALYYWHMPLIAPIVAELAMTVVFYIPGALLVGFIHRRLVGPLKERTLMPLFDKKDKSRYATFTRRSLGLGGGMTLVFGILAGRLYQLQIRDGDQYMTEAEDNRINERLLSPPRGRIFDRFGVELANNRRNYRVLLVAEQATQGVEEALDTIGKVIEITDAQKKRVLATLAQNKKFVPVPVAENLSWEEFSRINLHLPYLPGVQPDVGETRDYPFKDSLAHILGYVAAVSPEDKKRSDDPLLDVPGYRIGKRGIEKAFDNELKGEAGASRVEINAYGRVIRELGHDAGMPGKDVWLSLDSELQRFADQRLSGESAACVVMDATNGDVLALSSAPGFDPNWFNVGVTGPQWHDLATSEYKPLLNKAIAGTYPPGSTFKTAMALAAVDNGMDDLVVDCTGSMRLGDHTFYCDAWRIGGHGHVSLTRGIQVSCDVYFYEVARRLGIDKMAEAANALGLGSPTGIELPGELGGLIPTRAWKMKRFGVPWQQGETLVNGIGQGYVLATPIQLCTLAARLATGKAVSPRLTHQVGVARHSHPSPAPLPFSDKAFAMVREGMGMAVNVAGGTAYGSRILQPGFEMAGKTGTAQVRRITKEERQSGLTPQSQLPWAQREHALFIAFAPLDNPRYAASVVLEHGGNAHTEPQVQFARDILTFAQKRDTLGKPTAYPPISAAAVVPVTDGVQKVAKAVY